MAIRIEKTDKRISIIDENSLSKQKMELSNVNASEMRGIAIIIEGNMSLRRVGFTPKQSPYFHKGLLLKNHPQQ
jgi:hypothetical protein